MERELPELHAHLAHLHVELTSFLPSWLGTLFMTNLNPAPTLTLTPTLTLYLTPTSSLTMTRILTLTRTLTLTRSLPLSRHALHDDSGPRHGGKVLGLLPTGR